MRETRSSGSVEGVMSNRDPYSDSGLESDVNTWAHRRVRIDAAALRASDVLIERRERI